MRDIILLMITIGVLPFAFLRPHIGVMFWAWLGYMNPHRLTWGFAYDFPFVQLAAIATFIGMVIGKDKLRFPVNGLSVVWLLFILWQCVTTVFSFVPEDAAYALERSLKIQTMIVCIVLLIQSKERMNVMAWVMALSIGFFGVKGGIFTVVGGGENMVWGPPGSFIEGNNELALALIMVLPLFWYLQSIVDRKWLRMTLWGAAALCLFSILGSYSRGAFLAGGAIVASFWWKSEKRMLFAIPLVLMVMGLLAFMPQQWSDRMGTITNYEQDESAMGRVNAWTFAVRLAEDRPLVGGGFDTFSPELFERYAPNPDDFHDAHSIYFEVLAEQGFVGLGLFLLMLFLAWRYAVWIRRKAAEFEDLQWLVRLTNMCLVGLIGFVTGGAFLGLAYFDLPYNLIAIILVGRVLVERRLAEVEPQTATRPGGIPAWSVRPRPEADLATRGSARLR